MQTNNGRLYKAVVMGVSTGGISALKRVLGALPVDFPVPVFVVTHLAPDSDDSLAVLLNTLCSIRIKEADECEIISPGTVYLAAANYHLLIERNGTLSLTSDPLVNFSRPSVDVLFETAVESYGASLIGVIMTGAGSDGCRGLLKIKNHGGLVIVQDPDSAEVNSMPINALQLLDADFVVDLQEIPKLLVQLTQGKL